MSDQMTASRAQTQAANHLPPLLRLPAATAAAIALSNSPAFTAAITVFKAPGSTDTSDVGLTTLDGMTALASPWAHVMSCSRHLIAMDTCDVVLWIFLGTMQTASHADVVCHDTKNTTLAIMCAAQ